MNKAMMKMRYFYRRLSSPRLNEKLVSEKLKAIDGRISQMQPREIPKLFDDIPLEAFGKLYLENPGQYAHIAAFLPAMPPDADQDHWTGNHGWTLLVQSMAFVESILSNYQKITSRNIGDAKVLDFGCGWGRLIRLFYKYIPYEQIYGVDPWDKSIEICRDYNIKAHLAVSEYIPRTLPFDLKFDLLFAFSVFTHLSEKACTASLSTLRKYIEDDGLLIITIRPRGYWSEHEKGALASKMFALHDQTGFAFTPHNLPPIDGEVTYGDTSISLDYLQKNFPQWKIIKTTTNTEDPYQTLVFLRPA